MAVEQSANVRVDPYGFTSQFEEQVVYLLCSDADFYRRVGFLIEPDALTHPLARELCRVIHRVVDESLQGLTPAGKPKQPTLFDRRKAKPTATPLYVVQKLSQISRDEGKIQRSVVNDAMDYVERITDTWDLEVDEESVISLLVPELKRRLQNKAITSAMGSYRDRKEFKDVINLLGEAERLGEPSAHIGATSLSLHSDETFAAIAALQHRQRLPTGIEELDRDLGGGMPESTLFCVLGAPGAGKSVCLEHLALEAVLAGQFTLYATLEVEPEIIMSRFLANMSGIPINELTGSGLARAQQILMSVASKIGVFECQHFEHDNTTVQQLKDWVRQREEDYGKKCTCVIVDYADYLATPDATQHTYQAMKHIYRSLYSWAHKDKIRVLTASATKEKKDKRGTTGLDEASDSRYKARIVDVMAAIDRTEEGLVLSLPKNRVGKSLGTMGPFQDDFACGRLIYTNRGDLGDYIEYVQDKVRGMWTGEGAGDTPAPRPSPPPPVARVTAPSLDDW